MVILNETLISVVLDCVSVLTRRVLEQVHLTVTNDTEMKRLSVMSGQNPRANKSTQAFMSSEKKLPT